MKVPWKIRIVSKRDGGYARGQDTQVFLVREGEDPVDLFDVLGGTLSVRWSVDARQGIAVATLVVRGVELDAEAVLEAAMKKPGESSL